MTALSLLRRLYQSMFWGDERTLRSVVDGDVDARRYFHHVLAAERVWLLRLLGQDSSAQAIWPTLRDEEASALADRNREDYFRYLEDLSEDDLERRIEYVNQTGRRFSTSVADILTHVATHGAYHRGQVARAIRENGGAPVNTDFITWVREQD